MTAPATQGTRDRRTQRASMGRYRALTLMHCLAPAMQQAGNDRVCNVSDACPAIINRQLLGGESCSASVGVGLMKVRIGPARHSGGVISRQSGRPTHLFPSAVFSSRRATSRSLCAPGFSSSLTFGRTGKFCLGERLHGSNPASLFDGFKLSRSDLQCWKSLLPNCKNPLQAPK